MQAEDLIIDQRSEGEVVKQVGKVLPDVGVSVFTEALVVKTVYLSDLAGLVVSTEDGYALGVSNLERDQQGDRLDRVITSINIIAFTVAVSITFPKALATRARNAVAIPMKR